MSFNGQHAFIVGGGSGIGLATAQAFAAAGARVTIAGRSQDRLSQAQETIGLDSATVVADASDPDALGAAFAAAGPIDHLVATTGTGLAMGPLLDVGLGGLQQNIANKLLPQAGIALAGAPTVAAGGSITLVTGAAGRKPIANMGPVGMVNVALEALIPVLAAELKPTRVNAVAPGLIDTPAYAAMPPEMREGMFQAVAAALPVGRVGRPEDVAAAIVMLAGNGFVTGTVVEVDGGAGLAA